MDLLTIADNPAPAPTPEERRTVTNQMRVWELEQKGLVPRGLLFVNPQGFLRVQVPISTCEVDNDPLAIERSVVPELPEWLRDLLISSLTGAYGTPPHCCKTFHLLLVNSRDDPDPVGLTIAMLEFFFLQSISGLRAALAELEAFASHLRSGQYVPSQMCRSAQDTIAGLVYYPAFDSMPPQAMLVVMMIDRFRSAPGGPGHDELIASLDRWVVRPYRELLYKLETVKKWADGVVSEFEVPTADAG